MGLRLALVGKRSNPKIAAAHYLYKQKKFKRMQLDDGVTKFVRYMYTYKLHKRVKWEKRLAIYDSLYKLDPSIHIDYLLRKLMTTDRDVIVPDARYLNEIEALLKANFVLIRINTTTKGPIRLAGMTTAAAGTVKLQEYFGREEDSYPVSYSIVADDRQKMKEMLDAIIEKERAKLNEGGSSL